jgi:fructokinase
MLGGIEAGGTKFICGVGTGPEDLQTVSFPTRTPEETIPKVLQFFREMGGVNLRSIGIASFGPVDLDPDSPTFGYITSTPKVGWANFDFVSAIKNAMEVPVSFDTDVGAAILGEVRWGAARGLSDAMYITVGTGIGAGIVSGGQIVHGLVHPEMGHLRIPHDLARDPYPGMCTYHGDCLEGLACGPAIEGRWRTSARELPDSHPAWALEAHYIALALVNCTVTISPKRILLGGGVMSKAHLFPMIRDEFCRMLNGYVVHKSILEELDKYIQPPQLGSQAGILGALVLAEQASELAAPYGPDDELVGERP